MNTGKYVETKYIKCADVAKLVRKALVNHFPGHTFSVTSKTYSMGASIRVSWFDGPTTAEVDKWVKRFAGSSFDGMQDLKTSHYSIHPETGETVRFSSDYVFTERDYTPEFAREICQKIATEWGCEVPEIIENGYNGAYTIKGEWPYLENARTSVRDLFYRESQVWSKYTRPASAPAVVPDKFDPGIAADDVAAHEAQAEIKRICMVGPSPDMPTCPQCGNNNLSGSECYMCGFPIEGSEADEVGEIGAFDAVDNEIPASAGVEVAAVAAPVIESVTETAVPVEAVAVTAESQVVARIAAEMQKKIGLCELAMNHPQGLDLTQAGRVSVAKIVIRLCHEVDGLYTVGLWLAGRDFPFNNWQTRVKGLEDRA